MPRKSANSIGAVYARFSTRFQDSITDQVRTILEEAAKLKIHVPRDLVFFDLAVSGVKKKRSGLIDLETALKAKKAQVLLLFSTSRLFRKTYRTLAFVDQVHKGLGMRCIFIKSGVDTDDKKRWETILATQAMIDQFVVSMYVENIHAAHEGLLEKRLVFGTISYGYKGEPLEDELTTRGKPRSRIVLDEVTSPIVQQIFQWFVDDALPITEIIRRLNDDPEVPLPPRCASGEWTRLSVKGILKNSRYRGQWQYGAKESVYQPEADYVRQKTRSQPLKEVELEELRIVSDELWLAAQERLANARGNRGRKSKDGDEESRPKLLNGLLWCPEHDRPLYVHGWYGKFHACPSCQRMPEDNRPLFSQLNRELAMELTCQKVAELLRTDEGLVDQIMDACVRNLEASQKPDPGRENQLRAQDEKLKRSIEFSLRNLGESEEDAQHTQMFVSELRAERTKVQLELERLAAAKKRVISLPTRTDVVEMLQELDRVLHQAGTNGSVEECSLARLIIERITGGRISLHQQGEQQPHRGWLQGRFQLRLLDLLVERLTGATTGSVDHKHEIVIDYRRPDPNEKDSEVAWALYQEGKMNAEIAKNLGCSRGRVGKLIKRAADARGETVEDGRTRRSKLSKKHLEPPIYQQIADQAVALWNESDLLIDEIAAELGVDRNVLTRAVAYWHKLHDLPVPDGRNRRKRLSQKSSKSRKRKS
ncbi:recombinase family protein [Bremerella alba]|nr:recombinase family protein [Bremerella alba]